MEKLHHRVKKHYSYHKHFIPHYFVIVFYTTVIISGFYTLFPPRVNASETALQRLDQEIKVSLWGWVNKDSLLVRSNFDTPIKARLESSFYPFKHELVITPKDLLYPDTNYKFEVETKNWLGLKTTKKIDTKTASLPKVALANKFPDKTQIAADTKFQFKLESGLGADHFNFVSTPSFEYTKKINGDILVVEPKTKLKQGEHYQVSLALKSQTIGDQLLFSDSFSVIDPLDIVSSNPSPNSENVAKQTQLEFVFNKEVNQAGVDKLVKIEPQFNYTLSWKDSKTLTIVPSNFLQTNTRYTAVFADSISGQDGSQLPETRVISFTTSGKVVVVGFSPTGNSANPASTIAVTFNQSVDQASAQASFSINPNVEGNFSWSGNTLNYKTNGLGMLTTYTISIRSGVTSIGGEDSVQNFSSSFTTTSERSRTIGYSVKKRSITATYFGTGPKRILLIGTMHGSEANTGNMLNSFISYLRSNQQSIGSDRTFIIVAFANPDGRASNYRFNANNVDLNRNFDLPDWQALTYWQNRSYPSGGGSAPFSEPESRALRDLAISENPVLSISYHSNANLVLGDGIAQDFGNWYANLTGYTRSYSSDGESDVSALGYVITGTYEEWATKRGIPTLVIEFISQTANEYSRNLPALKGLLTYPL